MNHKEFSFTKEDLEIVNYFIKFTQSCVGHTHREASLVIRMKEEDRKYN